MNNEKKAPLNDEEFENVSGGRIRFTGKKRPDTNKANAGNVSVAIPNNPTFPINPTRSIEQLQPREPADPLAPTPIDPNSPLVLE